jgi:hypothetical protein
MKYNITINGSALFNNRLIIGADGYAYIYPAGTTTEYWFDCSQPTSFELEPDNYYCYNSYGRSDFYFTVTGDGRVEVPPAYASFMQMDGAATLLLTGLATTLDARMLTGGGLQLHTREAAKDEPPFVHNGFMKYGTVQLLPGMRYAFMVGSGIAAGVLLHFSAAQQWTALDMEGNAFDASAFITIDNNGAPPLVSFRGFPLLIDARRAGGDRFGFADLWSERSLGSNGFADDVHQVVFANLLPLRYADAPATGARRDMYRFFTSGPYVAPCIWLERDGSIGWDAAFDAYFVPDNFHGCTMLRIVQALPLM